MAVPFYPELRMTEYFRLNNEGPLPAGPGYGLNMQNAVHVSEMNFILLKIVSAKGRSG